MYSKVLEKYGFIITLSAAIFTTGIFLVVLLYAPKYYTITSEQIIIGKVYGTIKINRADVEAVEPVTDKDLSSCIRKIASGGLFGYIGKFYSPKLGDFYMYAGTMKAPKLWSIKLKSGKRYVISPNCSQIGSNSNQCSFVEFVDNIWN
ncbi:MAG: PH domain-containing protein [Bacteroidales bacterium]|nr:PH domain-containing protein [Bacteroidales bacterium]